MIATVKHQPNVNSTSEINSRTALLSPPSAGPLFYQATFPVLLSQHPLELLLQSTAPDRTLVEFRPSEADHFFSVGNLLLQLGRIHLTIGAVQYCLPTQSSSAGCQRRPPCFYILLSWNLLFLPYAAGRQAEWIILLSSLCKHLFSCSSLVFLFLNSEFSETWFGAAMKEFGQCCQPRRY